MSQTPAGQTGPAQPNDSAAAIIREFCRAENITPEDLRGCKRTAKLARQRWRVALLLKARRPLSWSQIARLLGRDVSSIRHGRRVLTGELDAAPLRRCGS